MTESASAGYQLWVWFVPVFALLWLLVSFLLSRMSGWSRLASRFRQEAPITGEAHSFASGLIGYSRFPIRYRGSLNVTLNDAGVGLSPILPFRFQSPPLFVPWSAVLSATEGRILVATGTSLTLADGLPSIFLIGYAGHAAARFYAQYSQRQSGATVD